MPLTQPVPAASATPPAPEDAAPHFANGTVPEAPARSRWLFVFGALLFILLLVALLRVLSGGTPFLLVGGVYVPAWFAAGVVGALLASVTVVVLRSHSITRAAGTGLVFFNCTVIYAFFAWLLLFT